MGSSGTQRIMVPAGQRERIERLSCDTLRLSIAQTWAALVGDLTADRRAMNHRVYTLGGTRATGAENWAERGTSLSHELADQRVERHVSHVGRRTDRGSRAGSRSAVVSRTPSNQSSTPSESRNVSLPRRGTGLRCDSRDGPNRQHTIAACVWMARIRKPAATREQL
jgi:hypothetical protein